MKVIRVSEDAHAAAKSQAALAKKTLEEYLTDLILSQEKTPDWKPFSQ